MAKKVVATLRDGSKDGRAYTKVIKMVRSSKTGAYIFDEKMVPNEAVQDFFKKQKSFCKEMNITRQENINPRYSLVSFASISQ